ncbi:MAG: BtrH N-terminal domain-containing protein [Capnocytophaga sp.]|nr:BtrH N-terminal domain-containing protein [Capnocytophaga sp.]
MTTAFQHHQSAHCENGVASNLLKHNGINISEPMIFGIGSGLFFFYFPYLKMNAAPLISYRPMPGSIFNKAAKRLGIKVKRIKFSDKEKARKALDENLKNNIPTGLQVGVYHLPYFPDEYRFHFNAHNLVVYGKEADNYLVSDPVMQTTTILTDSELEKVRFAKGTLAPKGQMYFPTHFPDQIDWENAVKKGIRNTCNDMLAPVPIIGVCAIRRFAKSIPKWVKTKGVKVTNHYLAQMVRMQEEIGTGGGGFRFIYGAFLQEAAILLRNERLRELSLEITHIGDLWREVALNASRVYKNRSNQNDVYNELSQSLLQIADLEKAFYKKLKKAI